MQLIIKGTTAQARAAAKRHGITLSDVKGDRKWRHTRAQAHECRRSAVIRWFAEAGLPPYSQGDLLFYS